MTDLRVRWMGTVPYLEAWDLQSTLFAGNQNHLLLMEHPPVFTLGARGDLNNILVDPESVQAQVHKVNRGGDVTFHGPGQLVGYPIIDVPGKRGGGMADTAAYVHNVEQTVIDAVAKFGLEAGRLNGEPGVWLEPDGPNPRKLAAVGVRLSRGRSMHGFALNVNPDMAWFERIVPCGISDKAVTSMADEGVDASMSQVVDAIVDAAESLLGPAPGSGRIERQDVAWRHSETDLSAFSRGLGAGDIVKPTGKPATGEAQSVPSGAADAGVPVRLKGRLADAGVTGGIQISERKPDWMRVKLRTDAEYLRLKKVSKEAGLTTVCEEAGCPNIFECWNEGTATFMLLGERCTRACGFCLVDTSKPLPVEHDEPERVADAIAQLGINFAVLTMVARDDLEDGGAMIVADTVRAIRARAPGVGVEVLISDLKGNKESLDIVCASRPDVVNHNVETVPRLQRAVRPSAAYSRSLALLARAKSHDLGTKSGLVLGMGETFDEVVGTLADLAGVGVDIVTAGQYLRPTTNHLAVQRWWHPDEFAELKRIGEQELGIGHVEANPLTRSSHLAHSAAKAGNVLPNS